ncbi:MAG: RIP metalloprotease [Chloroflexi bacterium]|nr:M50 family metallopeptidase [Chloroflexota bacterium]MQC26658.1 RIP metalloprotease [Chloroflexota bacterium]
MLAFIQFIGAVALLIIVHELGHFLAAKAVGIRVHEFGIGFPPRLTRLFTAGGTEFTLNWIPLGGFVRPEGEQDQSVEGGYAESSPWARVFMLISGPAMNFLAALLLFAIIFVRLGRPDLGTVTILDVSSNSPAAEAGLQPDDVILAIDGQAIDSTQELRGLIYAKLGNPIEITYSRDGVTGAVKIVPRDPAPAEGAIGIAMGNPLIPIKPPEALYYGGQAVLEQVNTLMTFPARILSGEVDSGKGRLVGYKGMYDIYTEVREADADPQSALPSGINTLAFFASISISLGLLNLLPVPALDGGRILFTLPELLLRKRIPQSFENAVNLLGLALLMLLVIYINVQDFLNPVVLP